MDYLICRGEEEQKVHLSEIAVLIVENTAVSLTAALIAETAKRKIKVIFCDEKHNPICGTELLYGAYDSGGCVRRQARWSIETKASVWTCIVRAKMLQQYLFLRQLEKPEQATLARYLDELEVGDATNREGHAARVYFSAVFGESFKRGDADVVNSALNYGYAILMSLFNREICAQGYVTQLGVFHSNEQNNFNLACDLMEPFRIVVDRAVYDADNAVFDADYRARLADLPNTQLTVNGKRQYLLNAVRGYVAAALGALDADDCRALEEYELSLYENHRVF